MVLVVSSASGALRVALVVSVVLQDVSSYPLWNVQAADFSKGFSLFFHILLTGARPEAILRADNDGLKSLSARGLNLPESASNGSCR